VHSIPKTASSL